MVEKFNCSYSKISPIKEIKPHNKNPNKHTKEQIERLAKLIDYQGQRHPVIVSNLSGRVVAGHGRMYAMKKLGWKNIAIDFQDFESEEQEYAFLVSDNAISEWAQLDMHAISLELENLSLDDRELLGIQDLNLDLVEKLEPGCDEDEIPEVKNPKTRRGDVWILGNHRVMCGDSTMIDDVEKLMKGEKADMVFTDPPYGINIDFNEEVAKSKSNGVAKRNAYKKIANDENTDVANDVINLCKSLVISKMVFWGANYYPENLGASKCWISWYKKEDLPNDSFCDTELAWTNCKKHSKTISVNWRGMIKEGESGQKRVHPNQKPIMLAEECFNYLEAGDVILDLFLGSGSTLIACEKTNRKCYGMELDEHYCDVIMQRWQKYSNKEAVLESTGEKYDSIGR